MGLATIFPRFERSLSNFTREHTRTVIARQWQQAMGNRRASVRHSPDAEHAGQRFCGQLRSDATSWAWRKMYLGFKTPYLRVAIILYSSIILLSHFPLIQLAPSCSMMPFLDYLAEGESYTQPSYIIYLEITENSICQCKLLKRLSCLGN